MSLRKRWRQMVPRQRILILFAGFLLLTVPATFIIYRFTAEPLVHIEQWTTIFWAALILTILQDLYVYGNEYTRGRLSGAVTAFISAYVLPAAVYDAYGFLLPSAEISTSINFFYITALLLAGSTIGEHIPFLRRIDDWFYRMNVEELQHMLGEKQDETHDEPPVS